jgi:hypothetical protein
MSKFEKNGTILTISEKDYDLKIAYMSAITFLISVAQNKIKKNKKLKLRFKKFSRSFLYFL